MPSLNNLDLRGKKITIMGIQGSGKTFLAKYISRQFRTIVYTPHFAEWKREKADLFKFDDYIRDFDLFCFLVRRSKYTCIVVDEADLIFRHYLDIKKHVNDLIINHRHYNKCLIFITRRPQDIPTKIIESCEYLFVFALEGANAIKKLNDIRSGFGNMVKNLTSYEHKFYVKRIGMQPILKNPIHL